jgi:hypothetical protein
MSPSIQVGGAHYMMMMMIISYFLTEFQYGGSKPEVPGLDKIQTIVVSAT